MAKGKDEFDIDFGDLDDDLDFDFDADDKPLTRIEKKRSIRKGIVSGAINAITSRDGIADFLSRAIPSEYGLDPKMAVSVINDFEKLVEKARAEGGKVSQELKRSLAESEADLGKILPAKYAKALKEYADTRERPQGSTRFNPEDDEVSRHMEGLFDKQEANEALREDREIKRDMIAQRITQQRHGESIETLGNVDRSINRLVSFNEQVVAPYQRKSLEIGIRQYFVQTRLLEAFKDYARVSQDNLLALHKEIAKPDIVKLGEHQETRQRFGGSTGARSVFGSGSGIVDRLRTNASKRAMELMTATGQAATMTLGLNPLSVTQGMFSEEDMYRGAGSAIGGMGANIASAMLARKVSERVRNSKLGQKFGGKSRFSTSNARRMLEERFLKGERERWELNEDGSSKWGLGHSGIKLIRDLLGDERGSRAIDTDNINNLQEPYPFTRQSSRTLNEVIPGLLGMIHKELVHTRTGQDPGRVTYDYVEGSFTSAKVKAERTVAGVIKAGDGDLVKDRVGDLINKIDPNGTLSPEAKRALALQLLNDNYDNRLASPERLSDASTYKGLSKEDAARTAALFSDHFKDDVNNAKAIEFSESFNDLLNRSDINRDRIQGLVNTGNRQALESAGIIRDGTIDPRRIMELMLDTDYSKYSDSHAFSSVDQARSEKALEEAKRAEQAGWISNKFNALKGTYQEGGIRGLGRKARGLYDQSGIQGKVQSVSDSAQELYGNSGIPNRVENLSRKAKAFLSEHGIDTQAGQLTQEARDLLEQSGLYDYANDAADIGRRLNRSTRVKGKRAYRNALRQSRRYQERGIQGVKDDIARATTSIKDQVSTQMQGAFKVGQDVVSKIPATATNIETQVIEYLDTVDPKLITSGFIDKVTKLAVDDEGNLKSIEEIKRDLALDSMKSKAGVKFGESVKGLNGFKSSLKERFASIKRRLGAGSATTQALDGEPTTPEQVQTQTFAEIISESFQRSTEELKASLGDINERLKVNREEEKEERQEDKAEAAGPRKGSWEDLMSGGAKSKKALVTSLTAKHDKSQGMGSLLGILGGAMKFVTGIPGMLASAWAAMKTFTLAGAAKGLIFGPKASTIGKAALGGAKLAGKGALLAGKGAVLAGKGLMGAWKMLPLLASPAGLAIVGGVAAAAAVGYGVYKGVQWLNRIKPTPLNQYRMVQYGIEAGNEKHLRKIAEFEALMHEGVSIRGSKPHIDYNAINWKKIFKLFDLPEKGEDERIAQFEQWVLQRFAPVYLVWATVTNSICKKIDFELPEKLKGEELKDFAEGVHYPGGNYTQGVHNPITGDWVNYGKAQVDRQWDQLDKWVQKELGRKDKGFGGKVMSFFGFGDQSADIAAAIDKKLASQDATGDPDADPDGAYKPGLGTRITDMAKRVGSTIIDPFGIGKRVIEGVKKVANWFVGSMIPENVEDLNRLNAFEALRYRLYGLTSLEYPKVKNLIELESECGKYLEYKAKGEVRFTGSIEALAKQFYGKFGIADEKGEAAANWITWFNKRFLPIYVNVVSGAYSLTKEKDVKKSLRSLARVQVIEVAQFILGTTTLSSDDKPVSVWTITASPWPELQINTDPSSIEGNLTFIREQVGKTTLNEETAKDIRSISDAQGTTSTIEKISGVNPQNTKQWLANSGGTASSSAYQLADLPSMSMGQALGGNVNQLSKPSGKGYAALKPLLDEVASMSGVDPFVLSTMIGMESSFDPSAVEGNGAEGLGQFVIGTWDQMIERYGAKYGIKPGTSRLDARANALMTAEYIKENMRTMKGYIKDRELNHLDVYMAHFLGPGGYRQFIEAGPNALGKDVRKKSAENPGNKPIFFDQKNGNRPRTVGEIMAEMNRRFVKAANDFGVTRGGGSVGSPDVSSGSSVVSPSTSSGITTTNELEARLNADLANGSPNSILSPSSVSSSTESAGMQLSQGMIPSGPSTLSMGPSPFNGGSSNNDPAGLGRRYASNGNPIYPELNNVKGQAGNVTLVRENSTDSGTFGIVTLPDGTKFHTLELPWRNNEPRRSCIPPGTYPCAIKNSPKFGTVYRVNNVPNRSEILFHNGNSAGDQAKGLKADSLGCILVGYGRGKRGNQEVLTDSKNAIKAFNEKLGGKAFTLTITGGTGDSVLGDPMAAAISSDTAISENPMGTQGPSGFSSTNPFDSIVPGAGSVEPVDTSYTGSYSSSMDMPSAMGGFSSNMGATPSSPSASQVDPIRLESLNVQRSMLTVLEQSLEVLRDLKNLGAKGEPRTEAQKRTEAVDERTRGVQTGTRSLLKPMDSYNRSI